MMCSWTVGTVAKFMSATHMGMRSKPSSGAFGAMPGISPQESTAMESMPWRSMIEVKSYFMLDSRAERNDSVGVIVHQRGRFWRGVWRLI